MDPCSKMLCLAVTGLALCAGLPARADTLPQPQAPAQPRTQPPAPARPPATVPGPAAPSQPPAPAQPLAPAPAVRTVLSLGVAGSGPRPIPEARARQLSHHLVVFLEDTLRLSPMVPAEPVDPACRRLECMKGLLQTQPADLVVRVSIERKEGQKALQVRVWMAHPGTGAEKEKTALAPDVQLAQALDDLVESTRAALLLDVRARLAAMPPPPPPPAVVPLPPQALSRAAPAPAPDRRREMIGKLTIALGIVGAAGIATGIGLHYAPAQSCTLSDGTRSNACAFTTPSWSVPLVLGAASGAVSLGLGLYLIGTK